MNIPWRPPLREDNPYRESCRVVSDRGGYVLGSAGKRVGVVPTRSHFEYFSALSCLAQGDDRVAEPIRDKAVSRMKGLARVRLADRSISSRIISDGEHAVLQYPKLALSDDSCLPPGIVEEVPAVLA